MKFIHESELMKNQKHAQVMAPDGAFDVLQASNGDALFFSIGTDHVLYATREIRAKKTGWDRIDLSSALSAHHSGATVTARFFALTQNPHTLSFDIALVVKVANSNLLYLSFGNSGVPDKWSSIRWTPAPFNAKHKKPPTTFTISKVYLMNIPSAEFGPQVCFVDITPHPSDPLINRYYIQHGSPPQWHYYALPVGFTSSPISCLGRRAPNRAPGIYTFGMLGDTPQLVYTLIADPFPSRLLVPEDANTISSALDSNGDTNLFVATNSGLLLFTPDNQLDKAHPIQVVKSNIFDGAKSLSASTVRHRTTVWGRNAQEQLFHVFCPAGRESDPGSWSPAVPFYTGVMDFGFYLNLDDANNVLFAYLNGEKLLQFTQDPVTSFWSQRSVLLPHTSPNETPFEYNSFTTHIQVTDDNGFNANDTKVQITPTSPVTVYINDAYYVLTPTVAVNLTTDAAGIITIVQETQSLTANSFRITLSDHPTIFAEIDPLSKAKNTLKTIRTGDDLGNIQITTADGKRQSLVPSSVSSKDKSVAAGHIKQLMGALPKAGSSEVSGETWEVSFNQEGSAHLAGGDQANLEESDWRDAIAIDAGDLFYWLKDKARDLETHIVHDAQGVYHAIIKIGDAVYKALLNTVTAVVGAVEFVFHAVEVAFEHLVAWLGFLFHWDDIKRTHMVMKNVLKQSAWRVVREINELEIGVKQFFNNLQNDMNKWADISDTGDSIGAAHRNAPTVHGSRSPQSHWALYHAKNNLGSAQTSFRDPDTDAIDKIMHKLDDLAHKETDELKKVVQQIKTQVVEVIQSLTPVQVVKKIFALISDLILVTAKDVVVTVLEVIKIIVTNVLEILDAPIDISILSSVYKEISGQPLSILDLACLVAAIPVTVMFKLGPLQAAPFPDNHLTQELIDAPNFDAIVKLLTESQPSAVGGVLENPFEGGKSLAKTPNAGDIMVTVLNFTAAVASGFVAPIAILQRKSEAVVPSKVLRGCAVAAYLAYVSPNFVVWGQPSHDAMIGNSLITVFSIGKFAMWTDFISPFVESYINLIWIFPAIGSFYYSNRLPVDKASLAANLVFDGSGILTFLTSDKIVLDPEIADAMFVLSYGLTFMSGEIYLAVGFESM